MYALGLIVIDGSVDARTGRRLIKILSLGYQGPPICTIYEIDEQDGCTFIVSMAPRSSTPSGGPLDLEILLSLAIEIADALDAKQAEAAYAKLQ